MKAFRVPSPLGLGLAIAVSAAALLSTTAGAQQASSDWAEYGQGRVRIVSATTGTTGVDLLLGLQYEIAPRWEIYWRTPGEAGYPTTIDWTGSENISDQVIQWPVPRRIQIFGFDKTVFVDVTAEWCITCLVDKTLVLNRGEVAQLMNSDSVVAMQADWTKPDPAIAAYLASFNRFGIPFNVIYGSVAPNGLTLPELLKSDVVMETFTRASGQDLLAAADES